MFLDPSVGRLPQRRHRELEESCSRVARLPGVAVDWEMVATLVGEPAGPPPAGPGPDRDITVVGAPIRDRGVPTERTEPG